jgi:membrane protease YdiL (CAAX protease family)
VTNDQSAPDVLSPTTLGALEPVPWGIPSLVIAILLAIGLFATAITTVALAAHLLGLPRRSPAGDAAGIFATILFDLCLFGVTLALSLPRRGMSLKKYGFRGFPLAQIYVPAAGILGMYFILGIYVAAVSALHLPRLRPVPNLPDHLLHTRNLILPTAIAACLVAPIVEESFFRGFVFRGLLGRTFRLGVHGHGPRLHIGFWAAALTSGLLFAVVHGELGLLVPFTLIGAVFAWMFWQSGSLWQNIIAHAGFNSVSLVLALVTQR